MHREVTRKQFLSMTGVAILGVFGIAPLLEGVHNKNMKINSDGGFGDKDFGGVASHANKHAGTQQQGRY